MKLMRASYKAIKYACSYYHYTKSVPSVNIGYSVFNDENDFCGVILYSQGANQHLHKMFGYQKGEVLELVRVAMNGKQQNVSKPLAVSLKLLKKDAPLCKAIVSYSDLDQDHVGTIYQATNWIYLGAVEIGERGTPKYLIRGKVIHGRTVASKGWKQNLDWIKKHIDPKAEHVYSKGKHKYAYPLCEHARTLLNSQKKEYPKHAAVA